jgi:hypothetical protein
MHSDIAFAINMRHIPVKLSERRGGEIIFFAIPIPASIIEADLAGDIKERRYDAGYAINHLCGGPYVELQMVSFSTQSLL